MVFLDSYVLRWMANHPHPDAASAADGPRQMQHPPSAETLNRRAEGSYLVKALKVAMMTLDAKEPDEEDLVNASMEDIKKAVSRTSSPPCARSRPGLRPACRRWTGRRAALTRTGWAAMHNGRRLVGTRQSSTRKFWGVW